MRLRFIAAVSSIILIAFISDCSSVVEDDSIRKAPPQTVKIRRGEGGVSFKPIGQGVGGAFFSLAISPGDSNIILAGTDMGCMFRTEDGGKKWSFLGSEASGDNPGFRGSWQAAFAPMNPDIAWASGEHGAYKSTDKGKTWKLMTAALGGGPNAYHALAIDPSNSEVVYISQGWAPQFFNGRGWSRGRVWKSLDGGKSWEELKLMDTQKKINHSFIVIDPGSTVIERQGHSRVFVGGQNGLYVSENAGKAWAKVDTGIAGANDDYNSLAVAQIDGHSVFFLSVHPRLLDKDTGAFVGGAYRSDDAGKSWKPLKVNDEKFMSMLASINSRGDGRGALCVLLRNCPAASKRLYLGSLMGIFRSDDAGETWGRVTNPAAEWQNFTDKDGSKGFFHLRRAGGNFLSSYNGAMDGLIEMAVAPSNPDVVVFNDYVTITASIDGGKTWGDLTFDYDKPFDAGRFGDRPPMMYTHLTKSRGLQDINPNKIAVDPFDPNTIFIAYADLGLRISRDGGETWEYHTRDIVTNRNRSQANSVVFDPEVKGRAYLNTASHGCIYVTEDGGRSFKDISIRQLSNLSNKSALDKHFTGGVVVDRNSPGDSRTLYCTTEYGIYKSDDGGKTWEDKSYGLENACRIKCLEIHPSNKEILFAGTDPDGGKPNNPSAGLYRSNDAGRNWLKIGNDKMGAVRSISICAEAPHVMYVVANYPPVCGSYWAKAALWRSDDSGDTWKLLDDTGLIRFAIVSPIDPNYLYMGRLSDKDVTKVKAGLFRSKDGGKTWDNIGRDISISTPKTFYIYEREPSRIFFGDEFSAYMGIDCEAPVIDVPRQ